MTAPATVPVTHWMLDIETLDVAVTAAVWEMALVPFHIHNDFTVGMSSSEQLHFQFSIASQVGRTTSVDTMKWMADRPAVWTRYAASQTHGNPRTVMLDSAYRQIKQVVLPADHVWCKGASFDFAIIKHLFGSTPWHYRHENCMRPIQNLAGMFDWQPPKLAAAHSALSDAQDQINTLSSALLHLRDHMSTGRTALPPGFFGRTDKFGG